MPRATFGKRVPEVRNRLLRRLIAADGRVVSNDALLFAMYEGHEAPPSARINLRAHLSRLRALLPGAILHVRPDGYRMDPRRVPLHLKQEIDAACVVLSRSEADLCAFTEMRRHAQMA